MKLHHIGIACADMDAAVEAARQSPGFESLEGPLQDPLQNAMLCLLTQKDGTRLELVAGAPVQGLLKKNQLLYHSCWEVENLDESLSRLRASGCLPLSEPKPAALFQGRRVVFLQSPLLGLMELLEAAKR